MNHIDQSFKLLLMASKDLKAMGLMIAPDSIDDEIFGFHAQQAVEKSLKAWIAVIGGRYGFTHDLWVLLLTLREMGCDIDRFKHLIMLSPFAAQLRYEPLETVDEPLERPLIQTDVQALYDHVQSVIKLMRSKSDVLS